MMGRTWDHEGLDQRLLDQLVDGELTDEQERVLIARLEDASDGWRRCALTFLENRCWQRAANSVTQPCRHESRPTAACPTGSVWRAPPWTWALVIAATFLVAFGVGTFLPYGGNRAPFTSTAQPTASTHRPGPELAQLEDSSAPPVINRPGSAEDLYLGNLKLVNDAGSEIDVPVYDWNQQVAEELMYRSQPLSPELVRQLKRHHVRSSRSYLPVRLEDGRQVVLPVEEVNITPVGGLAY